MKDGLVKVTSGSDGENLKRVLGERIHDLSCPVRPDRRCCSGHPLTFPWIGTRTPVPGSAVAAYRKVAWFAGVQGGQDACVVLECWCGCCGVQLMVRRGCWRSWSLRGGGQRGGVGAAKRGRARDKGSALRTLNGRRYELCVVMHLCELAKWREGTVGSKCWAKAATLHSKQGHKALRSNFAGLPSPGIAHLQPPPSCYGQNSLWMDWARPWTGLALPGSSGGSFQMSTWANCSKTLTIHQQGLA